jgi:4-amino-4-deoxy-L-arabinose transferase-like glycosyltransferase
MSISNPSPGVAQTQTSWVLFALVVVWLSLFFRLGYLPLIQPDEGRNAEVAREMKESGAWLSPSYNGIAYLDKPAFYFKAVALSLAAFGDNETAARLPSALFALALIATTFAFCRHVYGTRCAIMAVIVVATMPLFIVNARTVIFDIALALFVSAAIYAGFLAEESEGKARRNWYLFGAVSAGFATLVKGPVGFLIPGLVLFIFNRVEGRRGVWKRFFAPLNLVAFFGVTLPWFIGLSMQHPDFPYYGIVHESFHRFTTASSFHRSQPFYFYALIVIALFLPWSFILPEAAVAAWKNKQSMSSADRLCLVWSVSVVIFFSLSKSKLPGYILTVTVACGILTARFFEHAMANPGGKAARIIGRTTVVVAILSSVAAIAAFILSTRLGSLAGPLGLSVDEATALGHQFTLPTILLAIFAVLWFQPRLRRKVVACFFTFALFPVVAFTTSLGQIETVFNTKSARQLSQKIPALPPETRLAFLECFPSGLPFYLQRTATLITKDGDELTTASNYILFRLENDPVWPTNLVPLTNLDQWISQRKNPVYLVAREENRAQLEGAGIRPADIQPLVRPYVGVLLTTR